MAGSVSSRSTNSSYSFDLSSEKYGENWQYKIYFDPKADEPGKAIDNIEYDGGELLKTLVGNDEQIIHVTVFMVPLFAMQGLQWTASFGLYHEFVLFETKNWWWTIELHNDCITLQRSTDIKAVKLYFKQEARNVKGTLMMENDEETDDKDWIIASDKGGKTVHELIEWLYLDNQVHKTYHILRRNCQNFGQAVFDQIGSSVSSRSTNSSNSFDSSSGKYGENRQYKIYFDPEAGEPRKAIDNIRGRDNGRLLKTLVGNDEQIIHVTVYMLPVFALNGLQWTASFGLYHEFVLLETKNWWWTIELHNDCITLQRSKDIKAVKLHFKHEARNVKGTLMIENNEETFDKDWIIASDEGRKSVHGLIEWLYLDNQVYKTYHILRRNCQDFGKAVFNQIAKTKRFSLDGSLTTANKLRPDYMTTTV